MRISHTRLRQLFGWLTVCVWMGVIFWFSSQTAEQSSLTSDTTLQFLLKLFGVDSADELLADSVLHGIVTFGIRKSAHLAVFTVLGLLLHTTFAQYPDATRLQRTLLPITLGITYASFDELHQFFVPGRACEIRDVCIDTVGICAGVGVSLLFHWLLQHHQKKKHEKAANH